MIAKIALGLKYYGVSGRFVLFISTILVLMYLIFTLIRWVQTLSQLGTLNTTINKIEETATETLSKFRAQPSLGAIGIRPEAEPQFVICAPQTGYFTNFDIETLAEIAEKFELHLHFVYMPGKFVDPSSAIIEIFSKQPIDQ